MPNASTIKRQIGGSQQLTIAPMLVSVAATENVILLNNNALTLTGGGAIPLSAGVTGLYAGTGQVLHIHFTAVVSALTATGTIGFNLYVVPASSLPLTLTSGALTASALVTAGATKIATGVVGTAGSAGATSGSYSLDAYVQLDPKFTLSGWFYSNYGVTSPTGAKTVITGNGTANEGVALAGEQDLNFLVSAVSGTETTGTITPQEFSLSWE